MQPPPSAPVPPGVTTLRTTATAQHQELVSMVSQFLVLNNRVQEDAAQTNQAIYGRVRLYRSTGPLAPPSVWTARPPAPSQGDHSRTSGFSAR